MPGGGGTYSVPVSLLECDALVNVARAAGPLAGLDNLQGLAGPGAAGSAPGPVDLALLAEVDYTLLDMTGLEGGAGSLVLAGRDGIAVDRAAAALLGAGEETLAPLFAAGDRRLEYPSWPTSRWPAWRSRDRGPRRRTPPALSRASRAGSRGRRFGRPAPDPPSRLGGIVPVATLSPGAGGRSAPAPGARSSRRRSSLPPTGRRPA